jgi:transcriptional regulator with XRE-family HTH domain
MIQMTVNQRIKEARKTLKMSQKDFADAICISNTYLAGVENGSRKANDRLVKLCSMVFGISETWLKEGKGEIFSKIPDVKITRMVSIFNKLPLNFQDYALDQLEGLLKLRGKK